MVVPSAGHTMVDGLINLGKFSGMEGMKRLKALISLQKYLYFFGQNSCVSVALYFSTASFTFPFHPQGLSVGMETSPGGEVFFSFD